MHKVIQYLLSRRSNPEEQRKEYYINHALKLLAGTSYLEIGVRDGSCFRSIRAPLRIGVDPFRSPEMQTLQGGEEFYQLESDQFFAQHARRVLREHSVQVALVDGLHEFHQALRDIFNLMPYMDRKGVIFVHDCNPLTRRDAEVRDGGVWNGDVWKVGYLFSQTLKDESFFTIDRDMGVGVIGARRWADQSLPAAEVIAQVESLDYQVLEDGRADILRLKRPADARGLLASLVRG